MKTSKFLLLGLLAFGLTFTACKDEDKDDDTPPPTEEVNPLIGNWEAYDVSPGLAALGATHIEANFKEDNTYVVNSLFGIVELVFEGTYETSKDPSEDGIYSIVLNQSSPSSGVSEGIFKVFAASPDSMWYEVAQVDPELAGVSPATVEAGFGSTTGSVNPGDFIQKYIRK